MQWCQPSAGAAKQRDCDEAPARHNRAQINLANSIQARSLIGMGTGLLRAWLERCTHRDRRGRVHQIGAVRDRTSRAAHQHHDMRRLSVGRARVARPCRVLFSAPD